MTIDDFSPHRTDVEAMVAEQGVNLFCRSVALRRRYCQVRKVATLRRRPRPLEAWVTGQRREQALTRWQLAVVEWGAAGGCVKVNPLPDRTEAQVWNRIHGCAIPHDAPHDRGFPGIGCAPCTRAVAPGENMQSGRRWRESPAQKECSLHLQDGKVIRVRGMNGGTWDENAASRTHRVD